MLYVLKQYIVTTRVAVYVGTHLRSNIVIGIAEVRPLKKIVTVVINNILIIYKLKSRFLST